MTRDLPVWEKLFIFFILYEGATGDYYYDSCAV